MSVVSNIVTFASLQERVYGCSDRMSLFQSSAFGTEIGSIVEKELEASNSILSLDVFDTLILRDNTSELRRFFCIAEKMARIANSVCNGAGPNGKNYVNAMDAYIARELGTQATYRCSTRVNGVREGSLTEIHKVAARLLDLPAKTYRSFIDAEIELEATHNSANALLINIVKQQRSRGRKVILISDMYFHSEHLSSLLAILDIDVALFDRIYTSGDEKISKASGLLYEKISRDFVNTKFFHIGDNLQADLHMARTAGWAALHIPISDEDLRRRRLCHDEMQRDLLRRFGIKHSVQRP